MSSNILEQIKNLRNNLHNVGNLNEWNKFVLNQGARVKIAGATPALTDAIDNFTLVKLGFGADGMRECEALAASTEEGYLVATPEDYMQGYETISSFFNGGGEMARIVHLEPGMRFECSNVSFNENNLTNHPLKNGQHVHYDAATKKYIISNHTNANPGGNLNMAPGYQDAANKFLLVDKDCVSLDGQTVYRFEVQ